MREEYWGLTCVGGGTVDEGVLYISLDDWPTV
jgi:hypothetical protein